MAITPPDHVGEIVARARATSKRSAEKSSSERSDVLCRWWKNLSRDREVSSDLIRDEIGEARNRGPGGRGGSHPRRASLDDQARQGRTPRPEDRAEWQRLLMPAAQVRWRPIGVLGMIGTWTSRYSSMRRRMARHWPRKTAWSGSLRNWPSALGRNSRKVWRSAGIPKGLVSAVYGAAEDRRGDGRIGHRPGDVHRRIDSGRRVFAALGRRESPAVAELSGYDAAWSCPMRPSRARPRPDLGGVRGLRPNVACRRGRVLGSRRSASLG